MKEFPWKQFLQNLVRLVHLLVIGAIKLDTFRFMVSGLIRGKFHLRSGRAYRDSQGKLRIDLPPLYLQALRRVREIAG